MIQIIDWMNCIWKTDLHPHAKYIACYLRKFMNQERDIAWPSISKIQDETGLSRPTVCKYISELEAAGWIIKDKESNKSTTYIISLPKPMQKAANELGSKLDLLVKDVNQTSKGALPQLVKELYPNKQENKQVSKQPVFSDVVEQQFLEFWKTWLACKRYVEVPNHSSKKDTLKKWKKIFNAEYQKAHTEEEFKQEVKSIRLFATNRHKQEGFNPYINMMTGKFLTQQGWRG